MGNAESTEAIKIASERNRLFNNVQPYGTNGRISTNYREFTELHSLWTISARIYRHIFSMPKRKKLTITYYTDKAESKRAMEIQNRNSTCENVEMNGQRQQLTGKGGKENVCLIARENCMFFKTELGFETAQDDSRLMFIEQHDSSTPEKLEIHPNERKAKTDKKNERELELALENKELRLKLEESEKEKVDIKRKHEKAFLKLVSDNRKMSENLKEIQVNVRREKIESEQTKDEVEKVLQEREKLIDEVKELTKGFESMIDEKKRMAIMVETRISAFDSKLHEKDEEIRDLQETIYNDRKQFMEERDEYLTVIESLKAELLLHENQGVRTMQHQIHLREWREAQ